MGVERAAVVFWGAELVAFLFEVDISKDDPYLREPLYEEGKSWEEMSTG